MECLLPPKAKQKYKNVNIMQHQKGHNDKGSIHKRSKKSINILSKMYAVQHDHFLSWWISDELHDGDSYQYPMLMLAPRKPSKTVLALYAWICYQKPRPQNENSHVKLEAKISPKSNQSEVIRLTCPKNIWITISWGVSYFTLASARSYCLAMDFP